MCKLCLIYVELLTSNLVTLLFVPKNTIQYYFKIHMNLEENWILHSFLFEYLQSTLLYLFFGWSGFYFLQLIAILGKLARH